MEIISHQWMCSYDSWILIYLFIQYQSPLRFVSLITVLGKVYSVKHYMYVRKFVNNLQNNWFSTSTPISFTNRSDCHDITKYLTQSMGHSLVQNGIDISLGGFICKSLVLHLTIMFHTIYYCISISGF
jgi:hypothetical protein